MAWHPVTACRTNGVTLPRSVTCPKRTPSPSIIKAQAGKDSFLKVKTQNTYDCSSSLKIPSLKVSKNLPANGETLIPIPAQTAGTQIKGACGMGMYRFTIKFT